MSDIKKQILTLLKQRHHSHKVALEQEKDPRSKHAVDLIARIREDSQLIELIDSLPEEGLYVEVGDTEEDYIKRSMAKVNECRKMICKDSLQVQESCKENTNSFTEDLEEAARGIVIKMHPCLKDCTILGDRLTRGELMALVKAGAEWMRNQMPMPEDTVIFQKGVAEGRRLERDDDNKALAEMYGYEGGTESPLVKITFTIPKEQVKNLMPIKQGDVFGIENLTNKEGRR